VPARPRRRAVGPVGAPAPDAEPTGLEDLRPPDREVPPPDEDERLRADRPPHHDQGV